MSTIEDKLVEFALKTKYHNLPKDVVEYVKNTFMKTTAGLVYGSSVPDSKKAVRIFRGLQPPEAGVVGHGFRAPLAISAFLNGFFAHAAELEDDCFPNATSDITVVPVVFSLADALKLSGKEVIEVTTVAYEVMNRTEHCINPGGRVERVEQLGITSLPFFGVIGATIAAGRALDLTPTQLKNALGIAIGTSSGFIVNFGTTAHYYESAIACSNGVVAAMLAKEGCTGTINFKEWMGKMLGTENLQVDKMVEGLGEKWYACNFWIKKYPACFLTHRQIDMLIELIREQKISYKDVEKVETELGPVDATVDRPEPKDLEDARFSIQHVLASTLIDGDVTPETISWEKILDPVVAEMRKKIVVIHRPEWPKAFMSGVPKLKVYLKDGRVFEKERDQVIGSPKYPLSREQFIELYKKFASVVLNDTQIKESVDLLVNLEKLSDLEPLIDILVFRK